MARTKTRKEKVAKRRQARNASRRQERNAFEPTEIRYEELEAILSRSRTGPLSAEDHAQLEAVIHTLAFLTQQLEAKGTTLARLRKLIFGSSSEKTKDVLAAPEAPKEARGADSDKSAASPESAVKKESSEESRAPKAGHGRHGAAAYTGAELVRISHATLKHKDACPCCLTGKVYTQTTPLKLVRIKGVGPLVAQVFELERLRCNLCDEIFAAASPEGVGDEKYDASAVAMIGLMKYGYGMPFERLGQLMGHLGIPLPSSTQWELVRDKTEVLKPVWEELIGQAANGDVLYNDDTRARIVDLSAKLNADKKAATGKQAKDKRVGVFTTGLVSTAEDGHEITLFFSGEKHAGENLARVLAERDPELDPPIQMCDGLSANTSGDFEALLARCLVHARRKFVDVAHNFPAQTRTVLETLRQVYVNDAETKAQGMNAQERLAYHQHTSGPLMQDLDDWLEAQFEERLAEPNSSLGDAMLYMQTHWEELTLFLREPGAPLDDNIVERALKRAIRHRKNSLFYKTVKGAEVGDVWMSVVYTCERAGANLWDYLLALLKNPDAVKAHPEEWLPWNFGEALERVAQAPSPDG